MIPTRGNLQEIGRALYGDHWRRVMAEKLGRTKRTIERYVDGSRRMPKGLAPELERLVDEQIRTLNELIGRRCATNIDTKAKNTT